MEWSDENIEVSHPRKKTRRSKKIKKSKNVRRKDDTSSDSDSDE